MTQGPTTQPQSSVPPDDPQRHLTVARPDEDEHLSHLGIVGDTYTILMTGDDTAGKYTLIDMHVPPGGGPPPHRHDFEEMFAVLEGEVELSFRGQNLVAKAGETINVPANAPHSFRNASSAAARLLCMCTPPGQEELFIASVPPWHHGRSHHPLSTRMPGLRSWPERRHSHPSTVRSSCCPSPVDLWARRSAGRRCERARRLAWCVGPGLSE